MPEEVFKGCMMKFCNPQVKLLSKQINKPVFGEDEKIKVNEKFQSKMVKMNIIPVRTVKKKEAGISAEEKKQLDTVNKERTFVIQAHVVKVMKAQKTYRYQ